MPDVTPIPKGKPRRPARPKPLPYRSARRTAELDERARVREIVLTRDRHRCVAHELGILPEVRCESPDPRRPDLEVDELRGGSYRSTEYLNPDRCISLRQSCHRWKTEHKREFLRRLAESGWTP